MVYWDDPSKDGITIATNCFNYEEVQAAREWFRSKFGPTVAGQDCVLRLGPKAARKFCKWIAPHVPSKLRYKFPRDCTWPAFVPSIYQHSKYMSYASVEEVDRNYMPKGGWATERSDYYRNTRYCLSVKGYGNFFTTYGLVHNCQDNILTAHAWFNMQKDLDGERSVYEHDKELAFSARA